MHNLPNVFFFGCIKELGGWILMELEHRSGERSMHIFGSDQVYDLCGKNSLIDSQTFALTKFYYS